MDKEVCVANLEIIISVKSTTSKIDQHQEAHLIIQCSGNH